MNVASKRLRISVDERRAAQVSCSKAKKGTEEQSKAEQSKAGQGRTGQSSCVPDREHAESELAVTGALAFGRASPAS
jgi:hypothetical protein